MPLYKITEKRLKRKAFEDETGITALKAKMRELSDDDGGMDSDDEDDESASGSGSDAGSESAGGDDSEGEGQSGNGEEDGDEDEDEDTGDDEGDDEQDGSLDDDAFPITIESALENPIYLYEDPEDTESGDSGCVLCPGKILKHEKMIEVHLASTSHKRAAKRYAARLKLAESGELPLESDDVRDIVDALMDKMEGERIGHKAQDDGEIIDGEKESEGKKGKKRRREGTNGDVKALASAEGTQEKSKKRPSKKARREAQATAAAAAVASSGPVKQDGEKEKGDAGKLNRKARRLLAQQQGSAAAKTTTNEKKKEVTAGANKSATVGDLSSNKGIRVKDTADKTIEKKGNKGKKLPKGIVDSDTDKQGKKEKKRKSKD